MKVGLCISNQIPIIKGRLFKIFQNRLNKSESDWSNKLSEFLDLEKIEHGYVYIDKDNWIKEIDEYDILIWKPKFMGVQSSQLFKEKVYFIQNIMGKRIYPNVETVWHFDSKIAQNYLFEYYNIESPDTFVSFDYNEIQKSIENANYPLVVKKSNGAGSSGVKLYESRKDLMKKVNNDFIGKKVINKLFKTDYDNFAYLYYQEFIENNDGDLRINIIGDKYAYGFWRLNRKNDFRASGSGIIDYNRKIPEEVIKYCANISKLNNFDSMAYDVLFKNNKFVIIEMSYGYVDKTLYDCKGYYKLNENGDIQEYVEGHYWPQELWIKWVINTSLRKV